MLPKLPPDLSSQTTHALTLDLDPGRFRFSVWRNISITAWSAQATAHAAERVLRISRQLCAHFPEGRSQVMFIYADTPAPEDEASEMLTQIYDPSLSGIVCVAAVLEGSGFWASGIRSRITNMRIAGGNVMELRVQATVGEVAAWLPGAHAQRTGVEVSPVELRAALTAVRALGTHDEERWC